jgi:acetyl-CoA carboxylase biotin carboxyl carrier protein
VRLQKPLVQAAAPALVCRKEIPAPVSAPVSKSAPPEEPAASDTYIVAPMVGIFHRIDAVDGIGGVVKAGQVVGAIESMKLMNDIVSECDGIIAEALVEDGMPVEFGQALFRLEQA